MGWKVSLRLIDMCIEKIKRIGNWHGSIKIILLKNKKNKLFRIVKVLK